MRNATAVRGPVRPEECQVETQDSEGSPKMAHDAILRCVSLYARTGPVRPVDAYRRLVGDKTRYIHIKISGHYCRGSDRHSRTSYDPAHL